MSLYFLELPPTEGWKKIISERKRNLNSMTPSKQQESDSIDEYKVVYKLSEDGKRASLFDLYGEGIELEGDGIVVPLSSTIMDVENYYPETQFVNVKGSSTDKPSRKYFVDAPQSWLDAYHKCTGEEENDCYTDGNFYYGKDHVVDKRCNNVPCECCNNSQNLVGGHIIIGKYKMAFDPKRSKSSGNLVIGILPICNAHNKYDNGYMKLGRKAAVMLLNYYINDTIYGSELEKVRNGSNEQ